MAPRNKAGSPEAAAMSRSSLSTNTAGRWPAWAIATALLQAVLLSISLALVALS